LALKDEVKDSDLDFSSRLINYNSYTDTSPDYRANIRVFNKKGGFSSYQGDYPFKMTNGGGSVASIISLLTDKNALHNILFFPNINQAPNHEPFSAYIVDIVSKEIIRKESFYTNTLNQIALKENECGENHYFITDQQVGIPIYCVISHNWHLSFEHTQPHQAFINGPAWRRISKNLKNELLEIIT